MCAWARKWANKRASKQMSVRARKGTRKWAYELVSGQMSKLVGKWGCERPMSVGADKWAHKQRNERASRKMSVRAVKSVHERANVRVRGQMCARASKWARHYGLKQPKIQTAVLGHSLVRSLVHSHRSLVRLLRSRPPLRSLIRSLAHFAHSLARGTVNYQMAILSVFFSIIDHSARERVNECASGQMSVQAGKWAHKRENGQMGEQNLLHNKRAMEFFLTYRIRGNKMHNKGDAVIRDISCHKHTLVPYSKAAYERLLIIVVQAISSECSDLIRVYSYTKMFLIKILLQYSQYTCFTSKTFWLCFFIVL